MAIIGIDLGTPNSAAAVLRGGRPVIIPGAEGISLGGKSFPGYVAITADGETLIGEPARRQAAANPEGTATGRSTLPPGRLISWERHCMGRHQLIRCFAQTMDSQFHSNMPEAAMNNGDPEIPPGNPPEIPPEEVPPGITPGNPPEIPEPPGKTPQTPPQEVPPAPDESCGPSGTRHLPV